jgi:short-subunit dehydrogenase
LSEDNHKIAFITGASSGLGAEFALQLAQRGHNLILAARREERLVQLASSIKEKYPVQVTSLQVDLSTEDGLQNAISVINATPELDLLVNNAGFGLMRRFLRADLEKEQAMVQVHIAAPVTLSRAALPSMIARNRGAIINVSSIAGLIPIRSVLYGTSKAFLINFSEALQEELKDTAVHVQALCPGFTLTEFHDTPEYSRFSRKSIPKFLWMESGPVVSESLDSLENGKVICIPGRFYHFVGSLARNSLTAGLIKTAARFILRRRK